MVVPLHFQQHFSISQAGNTSFCFAYLIEEGSHSCKIRSKCKIESTIKHSVRWFKATELKRKFQNNSSHLGSLGPEGSTLLPFRILRSIQDRCYFLGRSSLLFAKFNICQVLSLLLFHHNTQCKSMLIDMWQDIRINLFVYLSPPIVYKLLEDRKHNMVMIQCGI